jgi:hypothetical protein
VGGGAVFDRTPIRNFRNHEALLAGEVILTEMKISKFGVISLVKINFMASKSLDEIADLFEDEVSFLPILEAQETKGSAT